MDLRFQFATTGEIIFGSGRISEIGDHARAFGKKVLIVTGKQPDRAARLIELLKRADCSIQLLPIKGEPTIKEVSAGAKAARAKNIEAVIGIGGGSPIDAAKAIAALATNKGNVLRYLEVIGDGEPLTEAPLPTIAIPTTAGAGAEVTRNAVLKSPEHKLKVSLRHKKMLPEIALVDPQLTLSLPPSVTAYTGLDALTQLIEPYFCKRRSPLTDSLCLEGMDRAARHIRTAYSQGDDLQARENLCIASLFGGLALANSGLGAVHGFAAPIGGMFNAPHGAVCAALLPAALHTNLNAIEIGDSADKSELLDRFTNMSRLLLMMNGVEPQDGVSWIAKLCQDLKVPGLAHWGITKSDIAPLVAKAKNASSMKPNPVVLSDGALSAILEASL